jgi:hypothetical protein
VKNKVPEMKDWREVLLKDEVRVMEAWGLAQHLCLGAGRFAIYLPVCCLPVMWAVASHILFRCVSLHFFFFNQLIKRSLGFLPLMVT